MIERIWLGVLCLSGWHICTCFPREYHYVADAKTWTEAQTYCRQTYTDLATVENNEEMNQLIDTVSSAGHSSEVWIGLYIEIDWRWSDGFNGSGADYKNWASSEPNFYDAAEFCVLTSNTGIWYNYFCSSLAQVICYKNTQLDPQFVVVNEQMSWFNAQKHCREHFIDLASVWNVTQNQKIYTALLGGGWAWIGLFRDPNFFWSDNSNYNFSYLDSGSNLIRSMKVTCGVAALQSLGKWKFWSCETRLPFVCYGPKSVYRRVLKVRMDSSVELNDPAVKADLLEQFETTLKEKGLSGVTLKWREQLDGQVFKKEGAVL